MFLNIYSEQTSGRGLHMHGAMHPTCRQSTCILCSTLRRILYSIRTCTQITAMPHRPCCMYTCSGMWLCHWWWCYHDNAGPRAEERDESQPRTEETAQPSRPVESQSFSYPHIHFIRLLCYLHSLHRANDPSAVLSPHLVALARRLEPIILPY